MTVLMYYLAIALTTGLTAVFTIHFPLMKRLKDEEIEIEHLVNPIATIIVLVCVVSITAPVMLKQVIKGCTDEYYQAYVDNLVYEDE